MKSIEHLPDTEKEHYILCDCGEYVDMRDLSSVFSHLHANLPEPEYSHSVRVGEPAAYPRKGKRLGLN